MKKLFTILFLALFTQVNAQGGITNLSFENWGPGIVGLQPNGWFGMAVSRISSGAQQGTHYVRIATTSTASSNNNDGMLMLGYAVGTSFYSGAPITQKPISINGFYKASGLGVGDSVGVYSVLEGQGSYISFTEFIANSNKTSCTSFSSSIINYTQTPDTIEIYAYSNAQVFGGGPNKIGSTLDLDNLSFVYATGIDELSVGTAFMVFPNPATSELTIISKDENATKVVISDLYGKVIKEIDMTDEKTQVDLESISSGVYVYSIMSKEKTKLLSNKFVIAK